MSEDNIVRPQSPFQEKYLKSNAKILVVGGAAGCLPAETEFLSPSGWVKISEWSGQQVGQITLDESNTSSAKLSFAYPKDYVRLPSETFNEFKCGMFTMIVSDEHSVPYLNSNSSLVVDSGEDLRLLTEKGKWDGQVIASFSDVTGVSGIGLSESDLRLQVVVMADGHIYKGRAKNNYTKLYFTKPRKIQRFKMLADKYGWEYRDLGEKPKSRYDSGICHSFVVWPKLNQKRYTDSFWNCTKEELAIIVDEMRYWDAHITKDNVIEFCSKHKEDVDFIQYALASQGIVSTMREITSGGKLCYKVTTNLMTHRRFGKTSKVQQVKSSDGMKYCFETESGFFLARQNGKMFVTGNSSKSYVGLMRHLRFVHDPNYRGFCIRKNSTAIMKAGGLFEQAKRLYSKVYPPINGVPQIQAKLKEQKLVFPSGATISFSHYENDSAGDLYHGLELSSVFYDEGTHADESHIWWLFSRLRTEADMGRDENGNKIEACMWISCNPDPDSFLFEWVKWWLYPEGHPQHGLPDPEKNGVIRWILRFNGDIVWGDSYEELFERYKRHDLPDDHEDQPTPVSFQCLLGNLN